MNFKNLQARSAHWICLLALCTLFAQSLGALHQNLHALGAPSDTDKLETLRTSTPHPTAQADHQTSSAQGHTLHKGNCLLFDAACGLQAMASTPQAGHAPVQLSSLRTAILSKSEPSMRLIIAAAQARAPPALF